LHDDTRHSESSRPGASGPGVVLLAPLTLWAVGFVLAFYPTLLSGFGRLQIRPGDPRLVHYLFEHSYRWITDWPLHHSLWSPPVFYPALGVGAYTDTVIGTAPLYWVWRAASVAPDVSYQLWMMACLSLNFLAAYVFLSRALRLAPWPSAVGALLFGFGSGRLANFNSGQLFAVFYGMAALYALVRVFRVREDPAQPGGRAVAVWLHGFAAFLALQIWSTWYPSFFLLLALVASALAALCFRDTRGALLDLPRRHPFAIASAGILGALAVAPMLSVHLAAAEELGWRDPAKIARGLPTWASWVYMGADHWLYGGLARFETFSFRTPPSQHSNGVGLLTLSVAVVGLVRAWASPLARIALVASILVVIVSTRWVGDFSLWPGVQALIPGAGSIRFVARIGMLLMLPTSIGVAFFSSRQYRGTLPVWLAAGIAALCVAEQGHRLESDDTEGYRDKLARLAERVDPSCEAFFLSVEHPEETTPGVWRRHKLTQVAAMWISLEAGVPTVNGNFGSAPPEYALSRADVQGEAGRLAIEAALADWTGRHGLVSDAVCHLHVPAAQMPAHAVRTGDAEPS
jgi:hypothetical protein